MAAVYIAAGLIAHYKNPLCNIFSADTDIIPAKTALNNSISILKQLYAGSNITFKCEEFINRLINAIHALESQQITVQTSERLRQHVDRTAAEGTVQTDWSYYPNQNATASNGPAFLDMDFDWESFMADMGQEFLSASL
jgi:hypothetical protein